MARELMLLVAAVIVCLAPGIHGTAHLSFADNTTQVNISRTGCGETKLCVETPDNCDPMNRTCLFTSIMVMTNASMSSMSSDRQMTYLHVELSGMSTGYIAKGLTMNATMGTMVPMVFVCAQNNGAFFFRTRALQADGTTLTPTETVVMEIRGSVNGSMIQCEFKVPRDNNSSTSNAFVVLGRGTTNGMTLGDFTEVLREGPHDLANPASVPTVMAAASAPAPAVLFLLCALIWPVVLRT